MRRHRLGPAVLVACGAMVLAAGCTGSGGAGASAATPSPLHAAPEPAKAPPPATPPAGTVVQLGSGRPEGLVTDPASGLVVVALRDPDRLAFFDPRTAAVVRTVPVPASARHLALTARGGAVLVPGEDTDQLVTVAVPEGEVLGTVATGRQPHDVAVVANGDRYVADEFGGTVSHLQDNAVVATFSGLLQPGGAAGIGDVAAVVDVRGRLLHLYRGPDEIAALPAGQGPTHVVAAGPGTAYVADTTGGELLRYATGSGDTDAGPAGNRPAARGSTEVPGRPYGLAYDSARNLLYVTATARNLLQRFRITATGLDPDGSWPTVRNAYSVTVVPTTGQVVVAGESGSELQVITP